MKKNILLILLTFLFNINISQAQKFQGKITYQGIVNDQSYIDRINDPSKTPEEKKRIEMDLFFFKKQMEKIYVLEFEKTTSICKETEILKINTENPKYNFGVKSTYYKNLKEGKYINKLDYSGTLFLIKDSLKIFNWELSNETKKIGKYTCHKAHYIVTQSYQVREQKDDGSFETKQATYKYKTVAWYTTEIPISNGPKEYGGLPGIILELAFNNSKAELLNKLTAIEIILNPEKPLKIIPPKGGKEVTRSEFERAIRLQN